MNKSLLVTGAGGFLGREIVKQLSANKEFDVLLFDLQKVKFNNYPTYDISDWNNNLIPFETVNIIVNCAFSRSYKGQHLTESLNFTKELLFKARLNKISKFINISSQSLYGEPFEAPWREETPVVNESMYAMAKYATELLSECVFSANDSLTGFTNLRLASLIGVGFEQRLVNKFIERSLNDEPITISGGGQILSFMDVRDAADGILKLLHTDSKKWQKVYNLGTHQRYTLVEIANKVKQVVELNTNKTVQIEIVSGEDNYNSGILCNAFYDLTQWQPKYDMDAMIKNILFAKLQ